MRTNECPLQLLHPSQLVSVNGDRLMTDSRVVAKYFGKRHTNVLRAYDALQCSEEFDRLNFESVEILDAKGQLRRSLTMTKDGFVMLAMGFTGARAMAFKEAYIKAFNEMAEFIANAEKNLWQRMQELIAKEARSQVKAQIGSRLMNVRRREIRPLREERAELETALQPSLLN